MYGTPAHVATVDRDVQSDLQAALAPLSTPIVRAARASSTLALPERPEVQAGDRAVLGFVDDLPGHAHLTAGAWPAASSSADPLQAVLLESVATDLQLSVGDELTLVAPGPAELQVRLVGTFTVDDASDVYWYADEQMTTGIVQNGRERLVGPFLTTPEGLLQNSALTSVQVHWRAFPRFEALTVDNIGGIHRRLSALPARLNDTIAGRPSVATGLPGILGPAERSLLVSRAGMLLVMAQLAFMAAYAIVLTANLLVDHRRVETALLRSRGAGPFHIAWLALAEGLLIVVPAVLIAPWLAVAEASILNVAGPLAEIGLTIEPTVTTDSYLLAGAAGLICLTLLVLPAFLAARDFASEERELSRAETRPLGQRVGLDVALLAISAIGLWQLRLYGAPLTRSVQGSLGFDPLLVAAPAIGLIAGAILALRVLPLLAKALESLVSRGREVVASLGSRQLARRPLRYTRTALLLILALSLGVFALSYSATWSNSQQDQAAYQAGADVRAVIANRPGTLPQLPAAYAQLPGVQAAMPVERITGGSSAGAPVDLIALDAEAAGAVVRFRGDESTQTPERLMQALRDGRSTQQDIDLPVVTLPEDTAYLQVTGLLDIREIVQFPRILMPGAPNEPTPVDPATLTDVSMNATAIVRDARGLLHRLGSEPVDISDSAASIVVSLAPAAGRLDGPLELVGLEVEVALPRDTVTTDAQVGVTGLSVGGTQDGPWSEIAIDGWSARFASGRNTFQPVPSSNLEGSVMHVDGRRNATLDGGTSAGRLLFVASTVNSLDTAIPVIANQAFLTASGATEGQIIEMTLDGAPWRIAIAGSVGSFPTTDPARPLLVFDQPTLALMRMQRAGEVRSADEWWLAVPADASAQVAEALRAEPFGSAEVVSTSDRARSLSTDPVALGIIGALLLGFVATGIFALVALVVSAAVSARQRRTEFALLRALGLSERQLSGWLWLENGSLVLVSLIFGTIVGVVISLIALPFITVTQQASNPVPAVEVQLPWDRILMLDLVVLIALGMAVAILAVALRRIGVGTILRMGED